MITAKVRPFLDDKLSECIGKPKELWEALKSLSIPKKKLFSDFSAVESNNSSTFDKKVYQKSPRIYFSGSVKSLLTKLLNAPNKYNLESVLQYHLKFIIAKSNLVPTALSSYSENIRWGQGCAKPSHLIDTSA